MRRKRTPAEDRFWPKVIEDVDTGCWNWTGTRNGGGYGSFTAIYGESPVCAHRFAYQYVVGVIPVGLQIDHLCRNRGCVNPAHLEPVTARENSFRARKTHCSAGHPFDTDNTYERRDGKRGCKECMRAAHRSWHRRRKERTL